MIYDLHKVGGFTVELAWSQQPMVGDPEWTVAVSHETSPARAERRGHEAAMRAMFAGVVMGLELSAPDVADIRCPTCGAGSGSRCYARTGAVMDRPHSRRIEAAILGTHLLRGGS